MAHEQTIPCRLPERMSQDRQVVDAVLDEALVCHVGFVADGRPQVLPTLHVRIGDRLYLHGSTGGRLALLAQDALPVCVTVTLADGIVLARSAFHHSMNYRSVIAHGDATTVRDETERDAVFAALLDHVVAGRAADARVPSARESAATAVLRLDLDRVAAKVRTGDPSDDPDDLSLDHWAGVIGLRTVRDEPVPAADLRSGIGLPDYLAEGRSHPRA